MAGPRRPEILREFLANHHLDGWIAWRPDELLLMAGHLTRWGVSVLLYPKDSQPVLFVPALEPRDHLPADAKIVEYPWGILDCADPFPILKEKIAEEMRSAGISAQRVGILHRSSRSTLSVLSAENPPLPADFAEQLAAITGPRNLAAENAFLELFIHKTSEEIAAIRLTNRVALTGIEAFERASVPGAREVEVAAAIETAIALETDDAEVFYAKGWAMVQSGPNSAEGGLFNRSTARRLQPGDLVLLELATCVNGYWSDLTRTIVVGSLRPELQRVYDTAREAQQAALDAVGPGVAAGEVDAAARNVVRKAGLASFFTHHTGHHVGFRYHDPGFILVPGATERLAPGMVITIEPGIYVPELGGGARTEDNVFVTTAGREILSRPLN
ncbi:MAG TPA: Xaa-Pro peptidase family protein [Verrucomicrobiae bacterium]|nr:Xaa-Pro peptidase family protein [Verrucomicrobiae bacterium]